MSCCPPQATFLQRLRQATRERHAHLEAQLPLLDPGLSREAYRRFVGRFLGYYAPLEVRLLDSPWWDEIGLAYAERRKTPRLEQDMTALGATAAGLEEVVHCRELPDLTSSARVLGCLYVIEGATLGGQIISRHLHAQLGLTPQSGAAFFSGYGEHTGSRWKAFGMQMTAFVQRVGCDDEIIEAANQTFGTIDGWLFPQSHPAGASA